MKVKLAEALLRRKELQDKVSQLKQINVKDLFELKAQRRQVSEGIDDVVAQVPKLAASQVTEEYDYYAKQLRLIDAKIQLTNWTAEVELESHVMENYKKV